MLCSGALYSGTCIDALSGVIYTLVMFTIFCIIGKRSISGNPQVRTRYGYEEAGAMQQRIHTSCNCFVYICLWLSQQLPCYIAQYRLHTEVWVAAFFYNHGTSS